jgi:hypothetical protein
VAGAAVLRLRPGLVLVALTVVVGRGPQTRRCRVRCGEGWHSMTSGRHLDCSPLRGQGNEGMQPEVGHPGAPHQAFMPLVAAAIDCVYLGHGGRGASASAGLDALKAAMGAAYFEWLTKLYREDFRARGVRAALEQQGLMGLCAT